MQKIKRFVSILLSIVIVCHTNISIMEVYCNEIVVEKVCSYNEWINEEGQYEYPIDQYDDEWYKLESAVEMREVTQLPNELLRDISTENLIKLVLKYPLLCDIKAFETLEKGYYIVKERFNGIQELVAREDAYAELLKAYKEFEIPSERILNYNLEDSMSYVNDADEKKARRTLLYDDAAVMDGMIVLEFMLLDIIENTDVDHEEFSTYYYEKLKEKQESEYYKEENTVMLLNFMDSAQVDALGISYDKDATRAVSYITIYTPNDNVGVSVEYNSTLTMCDNSYFAAMISQYNATHISTASVTFNCHSYAWLRNIRTDYQHIWLSYASAFANDSYYESSSVAKVGDIAYWGAHSAQVIQTNVGIYGSGYLEHRCISKWEGGPIVSHNMTACPYYDGDDVITFYRVAD